MSITLDLARLTEVAGWEPFNEGSSTERDIEHRVELELAAVYARAYFGLPVDGVEDPYGFHVVRTGRELREELRSRQKAKTQAEREVLRSIERGSPSEAALQELERAKALLPFWSEADISLDRSKLLYDDTTNALDDGLVQKVIRVWWARTESTWKSSALGRPPVGVWNEKVRDAGVGGKLLAVFHELFHQSGIAPVERIDDTLRRWAEAEHARVFTRDGVGVRPPAQS